MIYCKCKIMEIQFKTIIFIKGSVFMSIFNLEKVSNNKLLLSKLKENERILARFLDYDLKLENGSSTGNKMVYLTSHNRVVIYDDGGSFSSEKIYASDIYGLGRYDFNGGYPIVLDLPYYISLTLNITLIDLILYNEVFYKYLNFSKEPTILISRDENMPLKNLALQKDAVLFYNAEGKIIKIELNKIKDLKYGNRVLNITYLENNVVNKVYIFNLAFEPVKSIKAMLDKLRLNSEIVKTSSEF